MPTPSFLIIFLTPPSSVRSYNIQIMNKKSMSMLTEILFVMSLLPILQTMLLRE